MKDWTLEDNLSSSLFLDQTLKDLRENIDVDSTVKNCKECYEVPRPFSYSVQRKATLPAKSHVLK